MQPRENENLVGLNKTMGKKPNPADKVDDNRDKHTEQNLDHGLKETFPASDPVSIMPGAD